MSACVLTLALCRSGSDADWRARVTSLEAEKQALAGNVASLHTVLVTMQRQLGSLHSEYDSIQTSPAAQQGFVRRSFIAASETWDP